MSEGLSRRSFIKLAATAGAAAAIPGCEPAARKLIPYVIPDENVIPGVATYYATVCTECPAGCGVVAKVREGRVIKLEGNPADPISDGAICARGQSALQGVYNPDRLAKPQKRGAGGQFTDIAWDDALKAFNERLAAASKAGKDRILLITSPLGPTQSKIAQAWLGAYGSSRMITYEALNSSAARTAAKACFGRDDLPVYNIAKAEALISFGADFLETWGSPVEQARQWAAFRTPQQRHGQLTLARATYVGPRMSMTAARCDEWVTPIPGTEAIVAMGVLNVLIKQGWVSRNSGIDLNALSEYVAMYTPSAVAQSTFVPADAIVRMGETFGQADSAIAIAGTDDEATHTAVFLINAVTGNIGKTVVFQDGAPPPPSSLDDANTAIAAMRNGEIDVLVVTGGNPLFSMPPALGLAEAIKKVGYVAWLGTVPDETSTLAHLRIPVDHALETWHDTAPRAGFYGLGQPVTARVFDTKSLGDILVTSAHLGGVSASQMPFEGVADAVETAWQEYGSKVGGATTPAKFWEQARRKGGIFDDVKPASVTLNAAVFQSKFQSPQASDLTMVAFPHIFLYDGRGANKPWLQEIPEPITQFVWDSWVGIHPDTALALGVSQNGIIEISTDTGSINAPVFVTKLVRPGVLSVPIGQGHVNYGRYASGVGANPWAILPPGAMRVAVKARPTGDVRRLVSPLGNSDMMGRTIVEAMSIDDLARGVVPPSDIPAAPVPYELYPKVEYPKHKWGMTIDVNACTGCSACVAACYAENNLAVVGREAVEIGRIMSWLRVERYYPPADEPAPLMYVMPMLCQQCDHAPCEPVCPVFASAHTDEGLNQQIYNRCVGTRYCENNCTYKVRRFNWFDPQWDEPLHLQLNPDVTVRGAGVMEKCSFCIQRITHAEINAVVEGHRPLIDGEIVTACQQACPSKAITFGDSKDPNSAMMRRRMDNKLRSYRALEEVNTQPAIVYLRDVYQTKGKA